MQNIRIKTCTRWGGGVWLNNSARSIRNTFLLIKTWCACPLPASDSPGRGLSAGTCGHSGPHRLDPLMTSTELGQGTWELRYTGQHTHTLLTKHRINHKFSPDKGTFHGNYDLEFHFRESGKIGVTRMIQEEFFTGTYFPWKAHIFKTTPGSSTVWS